MSNRMTQPYRKGARNPSPALTAMLRGRDFAGGNPMDAQRRVQTLVAAGKRPKRPARPVRPQRPPR